MQQLVMEQAWDLALAKFKESRMVLRATLIDRQLQEWPDSRILTFSHVVTEWMDFGKPVPYTQSREEWEADPYNALYCKGDPTEARIWYMRYVSDRRQRHIQQVLTSIALCLQHEHVVFYECGMKDGSYQFRGARYGIHGSEYVSGFGFN